MGAFNFRVGKSATGVSQRENEEHIFIVDSSNNNIKYEFD